MLTIYMKSNPPINGTDFILEDYTFHNNKYHTITLTEKDLEWMKEANKS